MDIFNAVIFILHYFFFGMTALFFLLKFHKKNKIKYVLLIVVGSLWIILGIIDFLIGLNRTIFIFA